MKTALELDDDLYQHATVIASGRGCTVSTLVEDALRLLLNTESAALGPSQPMPSWDLGRPRIDIDDSRAVREALGSDRSNAALR